MNQHKILIVEDEQIVAFNLEEVLKEKGYDVIGVAKSGEEAVQCCEKHASLDLIIVDFKVQDDMNGEEIASAVRTHFNLGIPVIFISGSSMEEVKHRLPSDPCVYFRKPFDQNEFVKCVEDVLRDWAASRKIIPDFSPPTSGESLTKG